MFLCANITRRSSEKRHVCTRCRENRQLQLLCVADTRSRSVYAAASDTKGKCMLKSIRQEIIATLWRDYHCSNDHVQRIEKSLHAKNIRLLPLDHLAIIDLPGPNTGISELSRIFTAIGYEYQGRDY